MSLTLHSTDASKGLKLSYNVDSCKTLAVGEAALGRLSNLDSPDLPLAAPLVLTVAAVLARAAGKAQPGIPCRLVHMTISSGVQLAI